MRGSIRKRCGDDPRRWSRCPHSWTVIVTIRADEEHPKRQVWRTVRGSREAAERELTQLLHDNDAGTLIAPVDLAVKEYLKERWIPHMQTRVRESTLHRYVGLIDLYVNPVIGAVQLSKLRPIHVQRVVDGMVSAGKAPRTTLQAYRVLSGALRQAVNWQLIATNPAAAVRPPRVSRPYLHVPDPEAVATIIATAKDTPGYLPIVIAATTGMRRGEVAGLRWRDVDLERGVLAVTATLQRVDGELRLLDPKTPSARRSLSLTPFLVEVLRAHRKEQTERRLLLGTAWHERDLVVDRGDGEPYDPDSYTHWLHEVAEQAGVRHFRFHDLRHAYATALLREGIHPKIVSEALGHANVGFTLQVYSHVLPSMGDQAAAAIGRALSL